MEIMVVDNVLYPENFSSRRIKTHPRFEEELKDILEKSGYKEQFIRLYRLRLKHLEERWEKCVLKSDWFEELKNTEEKLYSMKFKGQKNIRVIFKFTGYKNREIVLLLCSFEEKNSKNNSKNSYSKAVQSASERFKEIWHLLE